jgi:hypothetical protein
MEVNKNAAVVVKRFRTRLQCSVAAPGKEGNICKGLVWKLIYIYFAHGSFLDT